MTENEKENKTETESDGRRAGAWPGRVLPRMRALPVWWIVPVAVLIGALAGGAYGMLRTPQYSATSYVLVVPTNKTDPAAALGFAQAYGRVASQVAAVGDAQVWAGVSSKVLKENVKTVTSPDAPMISVTATSSGRQAAVSMADGVARSLVLNGTQMQGSTNVRVVQFSRAVKPTSPVSPSAPLAALVGAAAGGLLGGLGLLVRPKRRPAAAEVHAAVPGPSTAPTASLASTAPVPQKESV
ncbi:lipopolysaccharide biosynthesis protein [Streptomyces sp. NPDC050433]|uniref:lipopolysaccharide biosynthesis protein n=1 Tax=unclassified Streptomyces TaxID=2593676 RepID=UPI003429114F